MELIIIGVIIAAILTAGARSLWRTWKSTEPGGCAGCGGCRSQPLSDAASPLPVRQDQPANCADQSPKGMDS